jgi:hypothetical protein
MDVASQIGDVGVRAEAARLNPDGGAGFNRWMAGADYAFATGLTLSAELYYNGAGSRDPAGYDFAGLRSGRLTSLATRYAGLFASYEITPLLKWMTYAVLNADDRSHAVDSRLVWSIGSSHGSDLRRAAFRRRRGQRVRCLAQRGSGAAAVVLQPATPMNAGVDIGLSLSTPTA